MNRKPLSRRAALRGAGGVAIGLPFLDAMLGTGRRAARAAAFPTRFLVFFHPNGFPRESMWFPTVNGSDFTLPAMMSALNRHKGDLTFLGPIRNEASYHGPATGQAHDVGIGTLLSGTECVSGPGDGACSIISAGSAGGPTLDQVVAQKIGTTTKFRSLQLGFNDKNDCRFLQQSLIQETLCYEGVGRRLPPIGKPGDAFAKIFGGGGGQVLDPTAAERLRQRKQSVLDAVKGDIGELSAKLGAGDRTRLDGHLAIIRDLEKRLASAPPPSSTCQNPSAPPVSLASGVGNDDNRLKDVSPLMIDLAVQAMACDLTRVVALQWGEAGGSRQYPFVGFNDMFHWHFADQPGNPKWEAYVRIFEWFAGEVAYLLDKMKSVPEGPGTMLDNTLVLWLSDLGLQNAHSRNNLGMVLAGKAGGLIQGNRFVRVASTATTNDLYTSILNLFGIPATTFGNPAYSHGPLAGVV